jgi:hypothetical protein
MRKKGTFIFFPALRQVWGISGTCTKPFCLRPPRVEHPARPFRAAITEGPAIQGLRFASPLASPVRPLWACIAGHLPLATRHLPPAPRATLPAPRSPLHGSRLTLHAAWNVVDSGPVRRLTDGGPLFGSGVGQGVLLWVVTGRL